MAGGRPPLFLVHVYLPHQQHSTHRDETARRADGPRGVPVAVEGGPAARGAPPEAAVTVAAGVFCRRLPREPNARRGLGRGEENVMAVLCIYCGREPGETSDH